MLEESPKGSARAYLSNCTFENCSNCVGAGQDESTGGALAVGGGAKCYCTDCHIRDNKAGGLFLSGSAWLKGTEFVDNFGNFGAVYANAKILSFAFCQWLGNGGASEGCCIRIVSVVMFECHDSVFEKSRCASIYFEAIPQSARFGTNCFAESGLQISSAVPVRLSATGILCFEGSVGDQISVNVMEQGAIKQNCLSCTTFLKNQEKFVVSNWDSTSQISRSGWMWSFNCMFRGLKLINLMWAASRSAQAEGATGASGWMVLALILLVLFVLIVLFLFAWLCCHPAQQGADEPMSTETINVEIDMRSVDRSSSNDPFLLNEEDIMHLSIADDLSRTSFSGEI